MRGTVDRAVKQRRFAPLRWARLASKNDELASTVTDPSDDPDHDHPQQPEALRSFDLSQ